MPDRDLFRSLHRPGKPLILFNIWDAGSAGAVTRAGAAALATGSASVAAPIRHQGSVLGSVSFFGPGEIINPKIDKLVPMLVAGAARISRDYRP